MALTPHSSFHYHRCRSGMDIRNLGSHSLARLGMTSVFP